MHLDPSRSQACRIIDADAIRTGSHRDVLGLLASVFADPDVTILCEPSVVRSTAGPPDLAIVDPASGLHVVEVKGVTLGQVRSVRPGGSLQIQYNHGLRESNPERQARDAMFDVRDAATRHFGGDLNASFEHWVAFPRISRDEWQRKFGELVTARPNSLFREDLHAGDLVDRLRSAGQRRLAEVGRLPAEQLVSLMAAFGDSAALLAPPRPQRKSPEGSLGERLAADLAGHRVLTDQQQRLASQDWSDAPRLIRGVAGSGKTVVLATHVARLMQRRRRDAVSLFDPLPNRPLLVVCFNRTLVPFIRERVAAAWKQRTGTDMPEGMLFVRHFNGLMFDLAQEGLVHYRRVTHGEDPGARARSYLSDLAASAERVEPGLFHAVFVDEGQDFDEDEYRVLIRLCAHTVTGLPRMFIFYDDAQNLYGRTRPTWSDLGLEVRGRSVVMEESFRNTRQILEPAFNVLLGSHAESGRRIGTRGFADLPTLREKGLVELRGRHVVVRFARREGDRVALRRCAREEEDDEILRRVRNLLGREGLNPHDLLILTASRARAEDLAKHLRDALGREAVHLPIERDEKDSLALQPGRLTVSTVNSAKGYDAAHVTIASAHEFEDGVEGRAAFYVACTRAREWLEVSAAHETVLINEFAKALRAARE